MHDCCFAASLPGVKGALPGAAEDSGMAFRGADEGTAPREGSWSSGTYQYSPLGAGQAGRAERRRSGSGMMQVTPLRYIGPLVVHLWLSQGASGTCSGAELHCYDHGVCCRVSAHCSARRLPRTSHWPLRRGTTRARAWTQMPPPCALRPPTRGPSPGAGACRLPAAARCKQAWHCLVHYSLFACVLKLLACRASYAL